MEHKQEFMAGNCFLEKQPKIFVTHADNPDIKVCTSCSYTTSKLEEIKVAERKESMSEFWQRLKERSENGRI